MKTCNVDDLNVVKLMNWKAQQWELNLFSYVTYLFKFTLLQFASLATSGANTAVVENGVSNVEI